MSENGSVLLEAHTVINGQRQDMYGKPENNFQRIADLWSAVSGHRYTPHDVAVFMSCLKLARIATGTGGRDSYVDLCGYAALAAEMKRMGEKHESPAA